jgi:hypothetical protein
MSDSLTSDGYTQPQSYGDILVLPTPRRFKLLVETSEPLLRALNDNKISKYQNTWRFHRCL